MFCSTNLTHNKLLGFNPTKFYKSKKIGFLELYEKPQQSPLETHLWFFRTKLLITQ